VKWAAATGGAYSKWEGRRRRDAEIPASSMNLESVGLGAVWLREATHDRMDATEYSAIASRKAIGGKLALLDLKGRRVQRCRMREGRSRRRSPPRGAGFSGGVDESPMT